MAMRQLQGHAVEKVWGQRAIPAIYADTANADEPIGEIWFADAAAPSVLVKRLFTSEKLSIQVHPNDDQARASGHVCGKEEAWFILTAEPGATIGAGFARELSDTELRAAALDGSIEDLMVWHPVKPGDYFYVPAGTVHAIGAGLSLLEIQQNVDLTYRLYDYGRPRPLQLDAGIAAAVAVPFARSPVRAIGPAREELVAAPSFTIERLGGPCDHHVSASTTEPVWLMPIAAGCTAAGTDLTPGTVWLADSPVDIGIETGGGMLTARATQDQACQDRSETGAER
ncbi:class I mannose-6-phosphate isomerase [Sphingomonas sp. R647]|uniref:class I mannose-6-phosphate isomerase n=1 Tax=Sphingomonas sp. R647 TaxID=2875233 RepID=UPI001CD19E53|nr:class I mannose-6-phosphate isomerase [Sphingomonas sp. R647]MCA1197801.1 class I mannose-6-phosphate isomerase [Sphingomonas sp. R647]